MTQPPPELQERKKAIREQAHQAGLLVKPWTVNEPAEMRRLIELGVDGLITDRPDLLVRAQSPTSSDGD